MLSLFYLSVGSAAQGCRSNGVTFVLLEEGIDGVLHRGCTILLVDPGLLTVYHVVFVKISAKVLNLICHHACVE